LENTQEGVEGQGAPLEKSRREVRQLEGARGGDNEKEEGRHVLGALGG